MAYILIVLYLVLVLLVGRLGRNNRLGYFGSSLLALLITPPIAALFLFGFAEPRAGRSGTDGAGT